MLSAFIFPGQGSQIVGMGKDLFDNFSTARETFEEIDESLGMNLSSITFSGPSEELNSTSNTQPSLMSVSMALVSVLEKDFGFSIEKNCSFSAGHSLGEYTSLCAMRSLTVSDTAKLLKARGQAMEKAVPNGEGGMAALIGVDVDYVNKIIEEIFSNNDLCQIANDNGAGQIVVSGKMSAIDKIVSCYRDYDIRKAVKLTVSGPFHSKFMSFAADVMEDELSHIDVSMPMVPVFCNVTAQVAKTIDEITSNLVKQVTNLVRWREIIENLKTQGVGRFVEIGPGKVLTNLVKRIYKDVEVISISNTQDIENFVKLY